MTEPTPLWGLSRPGLVAGAIIAAVLIGSMVLFGALHNGWAVR